MKRKTFSRFGALARRYALALFDLAYEVKRVKEIQEELQRFDETLKKVPTLYIVLEDKEVSFKSKQNVIAEISKTISMSLITQNAIMLIVEKGRLGLFDSIAESYRKMAEEFECLTRVEAWVANPSLVQTVKDRVEKILSDTLKKKVVCDTLVEPLLIGGAIVKIGDIEIDASIAGRLAKMKEELI